MRALVGSVGCVVGVYRSRHDQVDNTDGRAALGSHADNPTDRTGQGRLRALSR